MQFEDFRREELEHPGVKAAYDALEGEYAAERARLLERRRTRTRPPVHPGDILQRQYLEPLGWTIAQASQELGISEAVLALIVHEHASLTPEIAERLGQKIGTTPEL